MSRLAASFYMRDDVTLVARELLGKVLVTRFDGLLTSGLIVETEAYAGEGDRASHAYGGRHTARTTPMYAVGGTAYVYLCYGLHHLFNVVTNVEGIPHAVLIRAIEPLEGIDIMMARRRKEKPTPALTAGPGALSRALGITTGCTGRSLLQGDMCIEDRGLAVAAGDIVATTRVGVGYALEDALLPYRYYLAGNRYVSKAQGL